MYEIISIPDIKFNNDNDFPTLFSRLTSLNFKNVIKSEKTNKQFYLNESLSKKITFG